MRLYPLVPVGLLLALACGKPDGATDDDAPLPEGQTAGDCEDDADNDGDGLFDCDDSGCAGSDVCADEGGDGTDDTGTEGDNGRWPDDDCRADIRAGGDVPEDFRLPDQFGDTLSLYGLCDHVVIVSFGAMWDGASAAHSEQLEEWYGRYGVDGFIPVQILFEDVEGNVPSGGELSQWADEHRLSYPVVSDPSQDLYWAWHGDGAIPFDVLLGTGVEIDRDSGSVSESDLTDLL